MTSAPYRSAKTVSVRSVAAVGRPAFGRALSATLRDYAALTKPSIVLLLLITTVPAMVLAGDAWPRPGLVIATLIGGMLAASGACAVNMYIDRDIDAIMTRTRSRPVPSGRIPARHALVLGVLLGATSGVWLALMVNLPSAVLAVAAFLYYTVVYSAYLKRSTVHNTVAGGVAGAAPPLIGWTAVTGDVGLGGALLFLLMLAWQPPHFWALALECAEDYRAAGVPMMPVVRGECETKRQIMRYTWLTAAASLLVGTVAGLGVLYFAVALAAGAGLVSSAERVRRTAGTTATRSMFRYSTSYLTLLFVAMTVDGLVW